MKKGKQGDSTLNLVIAGDFFVSNDYYKPEIISDCVKSIFESADYSIVNLEAPIIDSMDTSPILKTGPNLYMLDEIAIKCLKYLQIDAVSLANNHIYDFGEAGLKSTLSFLKSEGFKAFGAGMTLEEARRPLVLESEKIKVAVLNFCENEFSTLFTDRSTANPLNLVDNYIQIIEAKSKCDKVICIVHSGHEYLELPSPRMCQIFRSFIDIGADAVICHHSHTISAYEIYKEAPIFYGLGNFLFTIPSNHDCWYNGLIARLEIVKNAPVKTYIEVVGQDKKTFRIALVKYEIKNLVLNNISRLSNILKSPDEHNKQWKEEILKYSDEYLSILVPSGSFQNRFLVSFFWRSKLFRKLYTKKYTAMLLNLMRCEAHRDALEVILKDRIYDRDTL